MPNTTDQAPPVHDQQIREMFSRIAPVYDRMNRILSAGRDAAWRRSLAGAIDPHACDLLDICCGTGELILTARQLGRGKRHVATDFCQPMLRAGSQGHALGEHCSVAVSDAQRLSFVDRSFDAVMVGFGLRNLGDLRMGLTEVHRVLRPGGQLLVLEFFRNPRPGSQALMGFYLKRILPLLGRFVGGDAQAYDYLPHSMGRFLTVEEFRRALVESGFSPEIRVQKQSFAVAHLVVARRPR